MGIELTAWECRQIALWAAGNALTYASHEASGMRLHPREIEEGQRWHDLAKKVARTPASQQDEVA